MFAERSDEKVDSHTFYYKNPSENDLHEIYLITPTYFCLLPDGGYVGLDLGPEHQSHISKIRFLPWLSNMSSMVGGSFQGSNTGINSGYEIIYLFTTPPHEGWNEIKLIPGKAYRYVRYMGPPGSHCVISKLEFYDGGTKLIGTPFGATPVQDDWDCFQPFKEGPDVQLSFMRFSERTGLPLYVTTAEMDRDSFSHQHDFLEMIYIKSGSCFHMSRNQISHLFAGDFLLIPIGAEHRYFGGSNLILINILFYPERFFPPLREHLSALTGFSNLLTVESGIVLGDNRVEQLHFDLEDQKTITPLVAELDQVFRERPYHYKPTSLALFLHLLARISKSLKDSQRKKNSTSDPGRRYHSVAAAIDYMKKNYAEMENVKEIHEHLQISYSRLAHIFKEETDISLNDYLIRIRIAESCRLLMETIDDVTEIAYRVGFGTYSNFSRTFKHLTGFTAQEFRSANQRK